MLYQIKITTCKDFRKAVLSLKTYYRDMGIKLISDYVSQVVKDRMCIRNREISRFGISDCNEYNFTLDQRNTIEIYLVGIFEYDIIEVEELKDKIEDCDDFNKEIEDLHKWMYSKTVDEQDKIVRLIELNLKHNVTLWSAWTIKFDSNRNNFIQYTTFEEVESGNFYPDCYKYARPDSFMDKEEFRKDRFGGEKWKEFKAKFKEGDRLGYFLSSGWSWDAMCGREYFFIKKYGKEENETEEGMVDSYLLSLN